MCNVKKRLSLEKQIAITIFLLGIILSIMIPTGQTPDEYSHLNMIGNSVGLEDFASNIIKSIPIEIDDIAYHYDEKIDIKEQKEALTEKPVYTRGEMVPKKISLTIIKHLPATLGIYIGIVLGLPAFGYFN